MSAARLPAPRARRRINVGFAGLLAFMAAEAVAYGWVIAGWLS